MHYLQHKSSLLNHIADLSTSPSKGGQGKMKQCQIHLLFIQNKVILNVFILNII